MRAGNLVNRVSAYVLTLAAAASLAACGGKVGGDQGSTPAATGGSSGNPEIEGPEEVEILTNWSEGEGLEALDTLIAIHQARRPNAEVTLRIESEATFPSASFEQDPPDTFQAPMGQRLLKWVDHLEPVTRHDCAMPNEALDVNARDGELYAVPISITRVASFFYNPALLESHGIDVAELNQPGMAGVQVLLDACATLATDPDAPIERPFALGNQWDWTLDMLFWEALFPAIVGPDYYMRFWSGQADPLNDGELEQALAVLLELSQYFNADSADIDFPEGLARIAEGQCAFGQQGDWGHGILVTDGYAPGVDFEVMAFPGTADAFVFSGDVFPIVAGTPNRAATQELLNTIASEELQVAFNAVTGMLPALEGIDIHATELSAVQKTSYEHFDRATHRLPGVYGFKPDDVMPDLATIEKAMVESGDSSELQAYIIANYALLGQ
jgi:glucose/mannose transport system substrate-binding protein